MENLRRERAAFQALLDRPFAAGLAAGGAASGGAAAGGGLGLVGHGGSLSVRPVDAASTGGAAAAASQAPARHPFELREGEDDGLSPSTGRKRRRTGEVALLDYTGKGDGFVVSDLTQRLQDLGGVLEKALAEAGARGSLLAPGAAAAAAAAAAGDATAPASTSSSTASSAASSAAGGAAAPAAAPPSPDPALVARACVSYALAWRRVAEAALARFEAPCKAAETVRGDVQTLFKRLLEASVAVPPASFASVEAAAAAAAPSSSSSSEAGLGVSPAVALANDVLASAGGLLALPYPTPADRMTLQLGLSRVEAWVKGNKAKPQPLAAVTSLADTAAAFVPVSAAGDGDAAAAAAAAAAARPGSATDEATATLLGSTAAAAAAASAAGASGGVGAVERERELRRTALERVQTLSTLLKALDRERDLMRAPYAPDGWKSRSGFIPPLHIQQQYAAAIAHLTGGAGAVAAPAAPVAASAAAASSSSGRSAPGAVAPLQGRVMPGAPGGAFFGGASIGGGSGGGASGFAPVGSSAGAAGDLSGRAPAPGPGASSGAASAPPPSGTLFTPLSSALSSALHFGASDGGKATGAVALPAGAAVAGAEPARKRSRWDAAAGGAAAPAGDDMDMGK